MIVADASVITKWFKPDEKSPEADRFLDEHVAGRATIFVPILLLYELTNALYVSEKLTKEEIEKAISAFFDLRLTHLNPDKEFLSNVLQISDLAHISTYDASYVALAQMLKCPLVTADRKLYKNTHTFIEIVLL